MQKYSGVTLVEFMVALLVVGVLAGLAIPSFRSMLVRRQVDLAVGILLTDFSFARSEAIKRGHSVTICQSASGQDCDASPGSWHQGWIVFDNPQGLDTVGTHTILRRQGRVEGITALAHEIPARTERYIHYRPSGIAPGYDNRFIVTADATLTGGARLVCLKLGRMVLRPAGDVPPC